MCASPMTEDPSDIDDRWQSLTAAERRIARLVAGGHTNKAIAGSLGVSPSTISTHLHHAYNKLRIHTRAQLGVLARKHPD